MTTAGDMDRAGDPTTAGDDGFFSGVPIAVDPDRIDRELARLWKPARPAQEPEGAPRTGRSVTRTCLSNLVFHFPDEEARRRSGGILAEVGRRFPSRMLILAHGAGAGGRGSRLAASISAVCHLSSPGGVPVCCEQIALEAAPGDVSVFRGSVLPLLVPDVPVVLVLLHSGSDPVVEALGDLATRTVLDSRAGSSLETLRAVVDRGCAGADDLAWRAILPWRRALAELFDEEEIRRLGGSLRSIEAVYRPDPAAAQGAGAPGAAPAALLSGWLCSRLGGEPGGAPAVGRISVRLRPGHADDAQVGWIQALSLDSDLGRLELRSDSQGFGVHLETTTACIVPRRIPARWPGGAELLGAALERPEPPGALRDAVRAARKLDLAGFDQVERRGDPGRSP